MNDELMKLREQLQVKRKQVVKSLTEIDNKLASIDTVIGLLKEQHPPPNKSQIQPFNTKTISGRLKGLPFKKSVILLLKDDPEKIWSPKDIFEGLLREGYESNSKNFRNTARTMLMHMRKKEEIKSIKTEKSYLYSYNAKDSAPNMIETESSDATGELGERSKPTDL